MIDEFADGEAGTEDAVVASEAAPLRTDNDAVDEVLASLEVLPELPLEEHVAVFEHAHEQLRGALDSPSQP